MANTYKFLDKDGFSHVWSVLKTTFKDEAQVNQLISAALSRYKQDVVTIVTQLPATGNEGILYLVPTDDNPLVFNAWVWELKDGSTTEFEWKKLNNGEAKIDLDDYYKKTEIDANFYNKTDVDLLLNAKVNTSDMQAISNSEIDAIMV